MDRAKLERLASFEGSVRVDASELRELLVVARERDGLKAEVWRLEAGLERLSVATSQLLSGGTFEIDAEVTVTPEETTDE